ncbi:transmembrane protein 256 [Maylandia zebra]|uniref:Transmembrane protein 256 n=4 Tax=Pseudocrenilabrinae TaxID=318546 RepID=A0A3Q4IFC7_NEOBR|nr:transmembrane protein 256 [Maylandia zebra]XP_005940285.1 transmembrane protein 256 isoform X1 [Haplochromis burtoni]XP_006807254.1 transmembrane protein 256 [Neolamprologus brichardi]XP_026017390.1 transmembrane protein 256 [Astatotilapia calliptera]XP_039896801.1 transmembrane protein 256 [Simochromis diagramma]
MSASAVVRRLAALSGASAVGAGAYGAHGFKNSDPDDYRIVLFETANKYHFYHSLALLGAAHCGKPAVAGSLLIAGMGMFCGSLYHQALTGDPGLRKAAPVGGVAMIVGWLAMIL